VSEDVAPPDMAATAARWRADEARRRSIMGEHAGTTEGVRLLMQHDPGHRNAVAVLEVMERAG